MEDNNHNLNKVEDKFSSPEEIASQEDQATATPLLQQNAQEYKKQIMKKKKFNLSKKQKIILIITAALVIVLLLGGYFLFFNKSKPLKHTVTQKIVTKPVSDLVPSDLTGLPVNPSLNNLPVTAVMVENSLQARPQSGLGQAGVVFEALAEGGVTRYMALYQDTAPSYVGPIRSARPYFIQWMLGFDAAYAHVGGSPLALSDIQAWNVKDLNQFYNGSYYTRISSRVAPHNVYTGINTLHALETAKGYTSSSFTSWPRQVATPLKSPTTTNIALTMSGPDYNPSYIYNPKTNSYDRSVAGQAEIGADTNRQVSPKVVIAIVVPETNGPLDSSGAYYSNYSVIGSGQADIFQNGSVQIGQWSKSSNNSQINFTDNSSNPIKLNPGQVWITAVTDPHAITYN